MTPSTAVSSPARWPSILAAPSIGLLLVLSWSVPLDTGWTIALGVVGTVIFASVALPDRSLGWSVLKRPSVLAALVMWTLVLFAVAYAFVALSDSGAVQTHGDSEPDSLGVAALLATAMGIAGGEVGVAVADAARIVAHIQLIVVVGAVAGAGGQVLHAVTRGDVPDDEPHPPIEPENPVLCLYRAVWERLTTDRGERVLSELPWPARPEFGAAISSLRPPSAATEPYAREVFDRIIAGDLKFVHGLPFWDTPLAEAVRPFSKHRSEVGEAWRG
ncbi:MAG TPA: hypothetical protein VF549_16860 [Solirubrobacteraceae bacterium]|jgi:hypothetical protein